MHTLNFVVYVCLGCGISLIWNCSLFGPAYLLQTYCMVDLAWKNKYTVTADCPKLSYSV